MKLPFIRKKAAGSQRPAQALKLLGRQEELLTTKAVTGKPTIDPPPARRPLQSTLQRFRLHGRSIGYLSFQHLTISRWIYRGILAGLITTALAGCAVHEVPTHFYALNATIQRKEPGVQRAIKVGVGPLSFPRFLQRPQVITRKNNNQINVADFHQWGGRLDEEFLRILSDNLVTLLGSSEIYSYPWESRLRPDYQVRINVSRFDGELGEAITLRARWQLLSRKPHTAPVSVQSNIIEPVTGPGYDDYVAAQSRALGRLAQQIAKQIEQEIKRQNPVN